MKNCHQDITDYHANRVILPNSSRTSLRERRNANRDRLKRGLAKNVDPLPIEFVVQGSYAHKTTIQERDNAHDIDDGVVFDEKDLKGKSGADKSPLEARKMVRDAVDDGSFKTLPEVKTNCVRVHYNDGSHVDIPVYRQIEIGDGSISFELASSNWRVSDPKGVRVWFENCRSRRSTDGADQLRDHVRLFKAFCKNRPGYSLPSGFVLSVLVDECFSDFNPRLDEVFRNVATAMRDRLLGSLKVNHPVVDERLAEEGDAKCRNLRDRLTDAIEKLTALDRANCRRSEALKVWKAVFNTDFFDQAIEEAEAEEKRQSAAAVAAVSYMPKPYASLRPE